MDNERDKLEAELEAELLALKPTSLTEETKGEILRHFTPDCDELNALERELSSLTPRNPDPLLKQTIANKVKGKKSRRRKKAPFWPILIMAAAAIVAVILILPNTPHEEQPVHGSTPPPTLPETAPQVAENDVVTTPQAEPISTPLAFSDPRAQAMVAAGYRPVSLEQMVLDTHDLGPDPEFQDARQVRVKVLQAIKWNNRQTGVRVDTKQIHEAIIRSDASYH